MTSQIPDTRFLIIPMEYPVLRMPDRLTVLEAIQFKELFHHLIAQTPTPQKVILDLNATQFMDSSGVGALVHNLKAAREKDVELVLANVHPPVMGVLSITGLDQLFTFQKPSLGQSETGSAIPETHLPETHPSIRSWLKRALDIVGGIVGLLLTGVIVVPIAIAIKIDSPGPVFFRQTRCGWLGKQFQILKFRSMCVDAEVLKEQIPNQAEGAFFKNKNDPRITKVGKFLRRTSLDELPQFWNVIKGDMSLVGTRPPTPDEVERYDVPQWQRLDVKPGMTGEWQVNGRSQVRNFEEVIHLDLRYQENWSLGYDLQLIFKTILILFHKNSGAF
jgi:exopolysaccharide biosynthesis polyprenyl glycosylphosphotransferase